MMHDIDRHLTFRVLLTCIVHVNVFGRNNRIMERHINKVYVVIEGSLTMLEDDNRSIHSAALPCVTQFPWNVSFGALFVLPIGAKSQKKSKKYNLHVFQYRNTLNAQTMTFDDYAVCDKFLKTNHCEIK